MIDGRTALLRAHVWMVATAIPLLVKLLPLRRVLRVLTARRAWPIYRQMGVDQIAATVKRRLRRPRNMKRRACLREGLTLYHFLGLVGVQAGLRFSVYPGPSSDQRMHAHCWLTVEGRPFMAPEEPATLVLTHTAS